MHDHSPEVVPEQTGIAKRKLQANVRAAPTQSKSDKQRLEPASAATDVLDIDSSVSKLRGIRAE